MSDKIRQRLGNLFNWDKEQIKFYQEKRKTELTPAYLAATIPVSDPSQRVRYLDARIGIPNFGHDEAKILEIHENKGCAEALIALEEIAISRF